MREKLIKVYYKAPPFLKRILFNIEAIRRNTYRRSGEFRNLRKKLDFGDFINIEDTLILYKLNNLLKYANDNVDFFKGRFNGLKINSYEDLNKIPLLTKKDIKFNRENFLSKEIKPQKAWDGTTSGSTGSPLKYYKDPESIMLNQVLYDKYYEYLGCDLFKKRIRLSGIKILPFNKKTPPYWVYIDIYKQLQCSVYHISLNTYHYYVKKFKNIKANFGTGLPSGWAALARAMNSNNVKIEGFKAIITDSEELNEEYKTEIEKAFNCPVYNVYGLGEVGMFVVECKEHNYHTIPYSHVVEVVDESGSQIYDRIGEIVVTDLYSKKAPFIRYKTGDLGIMSSKKCECGLNSTCLTSLEGRIEDYIITKDGRMFSRVSLIVKRAENIKESQIVQISKEEIIIRIVPDIGFNEKCMTDVVSDAKEFLGDMKIKWEVVSSLERMPSGKLKFLIKKEGIA